MRQRQKFFSYSSSSSLSIQKRFTFSALTIILPSCDFIVLIEKSNPLFLFVYAPYAHSMYRVARIHATWAESVFFYSALFMLLWPVNFYLFHVHVAPLTAQLHLEKCTRSLASRSASWVSCQRCAGFARVSCCVLIWATPPFPPGLLRRRSAVQTL